MTPTADDRQWFEREVVSALPDLYGTALRFAKNAADAEELIAETVAKAWTSLGSLQERSRFRGWLFRILSNTFVSDCRARAARPALESLAEGDEAEESFSLFERLHQPFLLWWGNPEQEFLSKLLREDLEKAVDALPEAFRVVVVLADIQGLSYREIADALGVPIGTVRSRLARGRSLLQRALWEHAVDAGLARPQRTRQAGSQ
jgi:RNA polymerase sigma-70 factor (ECF subfamily)